MCKPRRTEYKALKMMSNSFLKELWTICEIKELGSRREFGYKGGECRVDKFRARKFRILLTFLGPKHYFFRIFNLKFPTLFLDPEHKIPRNIINFGNKGKN